MQSWGQARISELIDEFECGDYVSPKIAKEARHRVRRGQEREAVQLLLGDA